MQSVITKFLRGESGAVTVDWVVLTAGIVGLAIAIVVPIGESSVEQSSAISTTIDDQTVSGRY